jgi:lipoate-protein ligase A
LTATSWRFIDTGAMSGRENMAIDEALHACFIPGTSSPVFRLYGWNPPAFSFGRFQKPEEILNMNRCLADGVQTVKRITGGGVIYHAEELTYSLVCPTDFIAGSSVKNAFLQLTSFLISFYRKLGLSPVHAVEHFPSDRKLGERTPLCFAGIESCDILINSRKIGGNAQRRLKDVIFQHGSIPLRQMADKGDCYLLEPDGNIPKRTTALEREGVDIQREPLADLLKSAFRESFNILWSPDSLTAAEQKYTTEYMQKIE